ncbi:STAS domain-containing protein [Rufibacter soli]
MRIAVEEDAKVYQIKLAGELDASTCLEVDKAIERALAGSLEQLWIDFSELTYISSAGLGVLISHLGTLEGRRINMVLYGMSKQVRNVFELLGLHTIMDIVPAKEDAALLNQER